MSQPFRVLHVPIELAGQMGALVGGLRRFGHLADGYNTFSNYLRYSAHIVNTDHATLYNTYDHISGNYDILHFHFSSTLDLKLRDLPKYKQEGKKMVMHHWGNDVRTRELAARYSPYLTDPCNPWTDLQMKQRLKSISKYVRTAIIQDFELYPYIKDYYTNIYVLPLAFPVQETVPHYPSIHKTVPLIIHAPTQPTFKGTALIESALNALWSRGYSFVYQRIEHMDHETAMQLYRDADIVIDQVLVGTYGAFAVEAMALGKPVVGYIRDDLRPKFPGYLPIVNGNPYALEQAIIPLLADAYTRMSIGQQSRAYALAVHDTSKVIPQLVEIYKIAAQT